MRSAEGENVRLDAARVERDLERVSGSEPSHSVAPARDGMVTRLTLPRGASARARVTPGSGPWSQGHDQ